MQVMNLPQERLTASFFFLSNFVANKMSPSSDMSEESAVRAFFIPIIKKVFRIGRFFEVGVYRKSGKISILASKTDSKIQITCCNYDA